MEGSDALQVVQGEGFALHRDARPLPQKRCCPPDGAVPVGAALRRDGPQRGPKAIMR